MNKIIAVDFDGTLCKEEYPKIGEPNIELINKLIKLREEKKYIIILWTCRHGDEVDEAVKWCEKYGLEFDYVNENVPELVKIWGDTRKVYADYYIDDHSRTLEQI